MSIHTRIPDPPAMQSLTLPTAENRNIAVRLFEAAQPRSVVIIASAMGVGQHCYEKFARYLQARGLTAITFDYFGTGASLTSRLRDCTTDVTDWGAHDCRAVIDFARERFPETRLQWIGHSVGGQLLGMTPNINHLDQAITVACGSGYWRENSPPTKRIAWLLWYLIAPASVATLGYFPGARLNMVGDLPPNVMRQWRRWCLDREYAVGAEGAALREQFAAVHVPITSLAFTDDEMMSRRNVASIHGFFCNAPVTLRRLTPADIGEQQIGHLGWFRERYRDSIWAGQIMPLLEGETAA